MTAGELRPTTLKRDGDGLRIEWSDGVSTFVTWRTLRKECPCATCNDERTKPPNPFRVLSAQEVAAGPPAPVRMKAVGQYAYQIEWNDGHSTGIYTLATLRRLSATEGSEK
jgi:DUF971 family protein